jgi:hypothetical protein
LVGLIRVCDADWLTPVDSLVAAENKLLQYRIASSLGVPVPDTIISSDPSVLRDLGERVVVKPLGPAHFTSSGGARSVFATAVRPQELPSSAFAAAPFLVQSIVEARWHLRVVTVREQAWVSRLEATGLALDWRTVEQRTTLSSQCATH